MQQLFILEVAGPAARRFRPVMFTMLMMFFGSLAPSVSDAADLELRLENAPDSGTLVFQVYDAADAFLPPRKHKRR
jgi:hypothetical protein